MAKFPNADWFRHPAWAIDDMPLIELLDAMPHTSKVPLGWLA
jgi:hypothetical protein